MKISNIKFAVLAAATVVGTNAAIINQVFANAAPTTTTTGSLESTNTAITAADIHFTNKTYDGNPIVAPVIDHDADKSLGTHSLKYTNTRTGASSTALPTESGQYNVAVYFAGDGDYDKTYFTINNAVEIYQAEMNPTVTLDGHNLFAEKYVTTYQEGVSIPEVQVGNYPAGSKVTVKYVKTGDVNTLKNFNLTPYEAPVDPGMYTIVVHIASSDSNYKNYYSGWEGDQKGPFYNAVTINKAEMTPSVDFSASSKAYDGDPIVAPTVTGLPTGISNYAIAYTKHGEENWSRELPTEVGKYDARIYVNGNEFYKTYFKVMPNAFEITKGTLSPIVDFTASNKIYDGQPILQPQVSNLPDSITTKDYAIAYSKHGEDNWSRELPTEVGEYDARIWVNETASYEHYYEVFENAFTIKPAPIPPTPTPVVPAQAENKVLSPNTGTTTTGVATSTLSTSIIVLMATVLTALGIAIARRAH